MVQTETALVLIAITAVVMVLLLVVTIVSLKAILQPEEADEGNGSSPADRQPA